MKKINFTTPTTTLFIQVHSSPTPTPSSSGRPTRGIFQGSACSPALFLSKTALNATTLGLHASDVYVDDFVLPASLNLAAIFDQLSRDTIRDALLHLTGLDPTRWTPPTAEEINSLD